MLEGVSTASAIVLNGEGVCFCVCVCEGAFSSIGTVGCSMTHPPPHPSRLPFLESHVFVRWSNNYFSPWCVCWMSPQADIAASVGLEFKLEGGLPPPPQDPLFPMFSNNAHKRNAKGRGGWTMQRRRIAEGGRWKGKRISCTEENNYTQLCLENDWIYLSRRCIDGHH